MKGHYTTVEAAGILEISISHVAKCAREGRFPGAKIIGSMWFFPRASVRSFRRTPPGNPNFGRSSAKDKAAKDYPFIPSQRRFGTAELAYYLCMKRSTANAVMRTSHHKEAAGFRQNDLGHYSISRGVLVKLQNQRKPVQSCTGM